jgi:hypothetical protein
MLVLYVSAARRGPVGGLSWFCGARLAFARVRVLAVLDTSAVGRLGTPLCPAKREIPAPLSASVLLATSSPAARRAC